LLAQDRFQEAEASLQQAIRQAPSYDSAYINLGAAYLRQGRTEEAIRALRQAVECAPHRAEAHLRLGMALEDIDQFDAALASYQEAVRQAPDDMYIRYRIGHALENQGKLDEASAAYQQVLDSRPDDPNATAGLASISEKRGDPDAAYFMLHLGLRTGTPNLKAALTLSRICSRYVICPEVISLLESLVLDQDLSYRERANAHFTLSWLYENAGNADAAARHIKQGNALKRGPAHG
jgi:tetratricopeptide (TPR) repeat protein